MSSLTLQDWGIIAAILFPIVGVVWYGFRHWRTRPRLKITAYPSYRQQREPFVDGFYDRHDMVITIKAGPKPMVAEAWGMKPTKGSGPLVLEQTGLPVKLDAHESIEITEWNTEVFLREPSRIYAEDASGKKWRASRKHTREAVAAAKEVIEKNKARKMEKPAWVAEVEKRSVSSLFVPADPDKPPPSIFGAPPVPAESPSAEEEAI